MTAGSPDPEGASPRSDGEDPRSPGSDPRPPDTDPGHHDADPGSDDLEARLAALRTRLEELDGELIRLVGLRRDLVLEVGQVKEGMGRPVLDPVREARVVRRAAERAREAGVDEELVRDVIWRIMASARDAQTGHTGWGPPEPPKGG